MDCVKRAARAHAAPNGEDVCETECRERGLMASRPARTRAGGMPRIGRWTLTEVSPPGLRAHEDACTLSSTRPNPHDTFSSQPSPATPNPQHKLAANRSTARSAATAVSSRVRATFQKCNPRPPWHTGGTGNVSCDYTLKDQDNYSLTPRARAWRPPAVPDSFLFLFLLLGLSRNSSGARTHHALHAQDSFRAIVVLIVAAVGFSLSLPDCVSQPFLLFL